MIVGCIDTCECKVQIQIIHISTIYVHTFPTRQKNLHLQSSSGGQGDRGLLPDYISIYHIYRQVN